VHVPFSTIRSSLEHEDVYTWMHTSMPDQTNIWISQVAIISLEYQQ
jgi:hypothetical protein